jgi:collagenase-like PrtC family protease
MNPNKLLVTITDLQQIATCKKARITNFLFPLKDYCVGYPKTFKLEEIKEEGYLYLNRILDSAAYESLKEILKLLPLNIKGLVFEDFGVITLAKELNLKIELILYQTHFATNHQSINENLAFVDSIVISTDITKKEIDSILESTNKPLVYVLYSLIPAMYSRRTLLSNFEKEFHTENKSIVKLEEKITKNNFIAVENEYGTLLYYDKYLNGLDHFDDSKIKFYLVNPVLMQSDELDDLLKNLINGTKKMTEKENRGFLDRETIYRLKEVRRAEN